MLYFRRIIEMQILQNFVQHFTTFLSNYEEMKLEDYFKKVVSTVLWDNYVVYDQL